MTNQFTVILKDSVSQVEARTIWLEITLEELKATYHYKSVREDYFKQDAYRFDKDTVPQIQGNITITITNRSNIVVFTDDPALLGVTLQSPQSLTVLFKHRYSSEITNTYHKGESNDSH